MKEQTLRELFEAYCETHNISISMEEAWIIWQKASEVTETYLKG